MTLADPYNRGFNGTSKSDELAFLFRVTGFIGQAVDPARLH